MRRAPSTSVAAVLVAAALSSCGGPADGQDSGLLEGLCAAIEAADVPTAISVFEQDVHPSLHEVAEEVAAVDRSIATSLLEAKFDVETAVRSDTEPPQALLRQRLEALDEHTREALDALDRPTPDC